MDVKEIADRLLKGSHNIDKMRKAIKETLCLLNGFMGKCAYGALKRFDHYKEEIVIDQTDPSWVVVFDGVLSDYDGTSANTTFTVRCGGKPSLWIRSSRGGDSYFAELWMADIQPLYERLPAIIAAVIRTWPGVQDLWSPLIKASYVEISE